MSQISTSKTVAENTVFYVLNPNSLLLFFINDHILKHKIRFPPESFIPKVGRSRRDRRNISGDITFGQKPKIISFLNFEYF